jgi:capsular polysaccharide transport system permease protein
MRKRHWLVIVSLLVMVVLPSLVSAWYLWARAADQYASYVGFSVRKEETSSAVELLGGITELSGSSSSDTDILYKFLESQELARKVDATLDLRAKWSRPEGDPVFAYHAPGTIEDLTGYWSRMVRVHYDSASGLLDLRINAFTPGDAQAIARQIFSESSEMINSLSSIAREDTLRYAREELETSVERLKEARTALTAYRNEQQIVDPEASIQSQVGLIGSLQAQLAEALIELDLLGDTAGSNDPRVVQLRNRVEVIRGRIADEQGKLGARGAAGDTAFADILSGYESLAIDREFAEEAYRGALAAFDSAQAEARRQSRYLAAHVAPTLAEAPEYPQRMLLLGLITLFAFLFWASAVLVAYSLKDRR